REQKEREAAFASLLYSHYDYLLRLHIFACRGDGNDGCWTRVCAAARRKTHRRRSKIARARPRHRNGGRPHSRSHHLSEHTAARPARSGTSRAQPSRNLNQSRAAQQLARRERSQRTARSLEGFRLRRARSPTQRPRSRQTTRLNQQESRQDKPVKSSRQKAVR